VFKYIAQKLKSIVSCRAKSISNMLSTITKRPSVFIKSPYVADATLSDGEKVLVHTPSLGCCGLAEKGATILCVPTTGNGKCGYRAELSLHSPTNTWVAVNPKLSEYVVDELMKKNELYYLKNLKWHRREKTILNSRFDFIGVDGDGCPFINEVKHVPLATDAGVAYFPDGWRKKKGDPVSPRAIKHLEDLIAIKKQSRTRCILTFVVHRADAVAFEPSRTDPTYLATIRRAWREGVEIYAIKATWDRVWPIFASDEDERLPIRLFDDLNTAFDTIVV
jgi:sugar fermentation stimulation protein A